MSNVIQTYEDSVRLKPECPKGGGKLPPPFTALHRPAHQHCEKNVRFSGTWRKGGDNLYPPFGRGSVVHPSRDNLSRLENSCEGVGHA